jgi:excisionase family DNA binding protein
MRSPENAGAERLLTVAEAADTLGIHRWKLSRAVTAGIVPSYRLFNGRRLVRLSEIIAVIERSREGGA